MPMKDSSLHVFCLLAPASGILGQPPFFLTLLEQQRSVQVGKDDTFALVGRSHSLRSLSDFILILIGD